MVRFINLNIVSAAITFSVFLLIARVIEFQLGVTIIVGSFGSATIVLFALEGTQTGKPYNVIIGHLISVSAGMLSRIYILPVSLDAALLIAIIGTLTAMKIFRCIHPPGGAVALIIVIAPVEEVGNGWPIAAGIMIGIFIFLVIKSVIYLLADYLKTWRLTS